MSPKDNIQKDPTISELLELGRMGKAYFEDTLGYTEVAFIDVTLRAHGNHTVYFTIYDDFQREIPEDMRYRNSYMESIDLGVFWDKLLTWPNREQRELEILARKMASIDGNLADIQSAQVLAFVKRIQPEIDKIRAAITDQRTVA